MQLVLFTQNSSVESYWLSYLDSLHVKSIYTLEELQSITKESIIIADFDSVSHDINKLFSEDKVPPKLIVLEKDPTLMTGKMLIFKHIKAYGNSMMLKSHFLQMISTVENNKVWTYPELTAQLAISSKNRDKNSDLSILNRLSEQENNVVHLILEGLCNDAIGTRLNISTRTVKAHVSSIFSKLHVNDRISLILLIKQ